MNLRMIRYIIGCVLMIEGAMLLIPFIVSLIYAEYSVGIVYLICMIVFFLLGLILSRKKTEKSRLSRKDGFIAVALSWLVICFTGALPFVLSQEIPSFVDALFEIVSGFTTTGASIVENVEMLSHTTLMWRSLSHWIGGMGVLVFLLMAVPFRKGTHMNLMKAESPGPDVSKFVPKVRETAALLYFIYMALTLFQIVILIISGMATFDAVCISLGTAGTGGFSVLASGCASYTAAQQWIIMIFMVAFGVNFSFYYFIIRKKVGAAIRMEEVRIYILIIVSAIVLITINIMPMFNNAGDAIRESAFHVGSIITTTGYAVSDFNLWPALSKAILLILMFLGACAGSTGGGIKISRIIILFKTVINEIQNLVHPKRVKRVCMDGKPIPIEREKSVLIYFGAFMIIFVLSFLVISIDNFSFETNFSAVAATINNIGPGLDVVGPMGNFASFGIASKIVLILDMLVGRLEIFPILILLNPRIWKKTSA